MSTRKQEPSEADRRNAGVKRASHAAGAPPSGKAVRKTAAKPARKTGAKDTGKTARENSSRPALEDVYVPTRAAWRQWLAKNHDRSPGIWLVFDRKSSRPDRLAYADSVEEALCFGWIDSTVRSVDPAHYKQLFTPRKPKSGWSRINKERVERLIAEGLMTPAGMARIDQAKANGAWVALDEVEALIVPPDLSDALAADPAARTHFERFSPSARKAYLYWLNGAKRPETRARRLAEIVRLAAANRRVPG